MSNLNIPQHGFSNLEFEERLSKAQKIMHKQQLDAIFVTTPQNIRYFTGFDSQFWESPTRPWFVIVPNEGKPIAVIPEIGQPAMQSTWLDDVRTWTAPNPKDDGISLLKSTLEQCSKRFKKIGAELGREMSLRMPIIDFYKLKEKTQLEIVDGSPAIWNMRMVKTKA